MKHLTVADRDDVRTHSEKDLYKAVVSVFGEGSQQALHVLKEQRLREDIIAEFLKARNFILRFQEPDKGELSAASDIDNIIQRIKELK